MQYLIDGHNLIGKLPGLSLDDPDDEIKLMQLLKRWCAADRRRKVTVIFDAGLPGGEAKHLSGGGVKVIFAPANRSADALLIARIKQIKNPPEYTIVSSDESILSVARRHRVPIQRSDTFATAMVSDRSFGGKKPESPRDERPDPADMTPDDLAEWLALFGPEPEIPAPVRRPTPAEIKQRQELQEKKAREQKRAEELDEWLRLFGYKE